MAALSLNNGQHIPTVGLGTWQAPLDEVVATVKFAIDAGYRHIDTALVYGTEPGVGQAVREKVQEGAVHREDIFITTKLWNTHHSVEDVVLACKTSLENLGLEYIDLYLVHWPFGFKTKEPLRVPQQFDSFDQTSIEDTWRQMEKCVELGLVKSIGLSNFNKAQIQRVLDIATVKPVVNQIECHMMLNQKPLIEFCKSVDIVVEAYSPFGSPSRPNAPSDATNIFQDSRLLQIAAKYSKTTAQIILRYLIQLGVVVLPKSVTPERIKQNLQVFDFQLSSEDMSVLASLDCGMRLFTYLVAKDHPDYPFVGESVENMKFDSDPCSAGLLDTIKK
ncbi:hypothetical protein J6590_031762 [Homalodisca vitripennis]|nr:hypothetical protein J6590_031762 [Homalodisca vitripennis]